MALLKDQLQSRLDELDSQISRIRKGADEEIAKLEKRKSKLLQASTVLTPTLETLVTELQNEGFLGGDRD